MNRESTRVKEREIRAMKPTGTREVILVRLKVVILLGC